MCYMVYLSTDCPDDLSLQTSDLVRFDTPSVETLSPRPRGLSYEHAWHVGSKSGCSCTFRHLSRQSIDLGFDVPQDWSAEEEDAIDATRRLYEIVKALVERAHQVEVLDLWSGDEDTEPVVLEVSLSQVPADRFRLFEGHVFSLRP